MDFARFLVLTPHWSEGQLGFKGGAYLEDTFSGLGLSPDILGGVMPGDPQRTGKLESSLLYSSYYKHRILKLGLQKPKDFSEKNMNNNFYGFTE